MTTIDVERTQIQADRAEIAVELVQRRIVDHRARIAVTSPERMDIGVHSAATDALGVSLLRFTGISYRAEVEPSDHDVLVGQLVDGRGHLTTPHDRLAMTPRDVFMASADFAMVAEMQDLVFNLVRIPLADVADCAAEVCDLSPQKPLRFHAVTPIPSARRIWQDTSMLLHRQLVDPGCDRINSLALHGLNRMAAAALLTAFPNTTMTTARQRGPGPTTPATIRRAMQFIEDHAAEPLTLARIAAHVRVTPRALQTGFRSHLDTTPLGYLRRVRLEHVHRELQDADPTQGATVEGIAVRWGFTHPARFAAWYRQTYTVLPSHTLRS
ncbi:helix-turn-helix transcriptional regulator [Nocardia sp. IFM 10818]